MNILYKILLVLVFVLYPFISQADSFYVDPARDVFYSNEVFSMPVYLDVGSNRVNAIEGVLVFDKGFLEVVNVLDGNSAINFWLEKPGKSEDGNIKFSGIITGGISGPRIFLFNVVFRARKIGNSELSFKDVGVFLNDGQGTRVPLNAKPFIFRIEGGLDSMDNYSFVNIDKNKPESFSPFIFKDPSIFDNKYSVAFSTVDKDSGMSHFEIKETYTGIDGTFVVAESPYLLKDQNLYKNIYIKAVDKNGNARIVKISAMHKRNVFIVDAIIGIITLLCLILLRKKYSKF